MSADGSPDARAGRPSPLTPHETAALAALADRLRGDDPQLAATLSAPVPERDPAAALPVPPARHLAGLVAALAALAGVAALTGDRLGVAGTFVLTAAAVVPWLVLTARAAGRRAAAGAPPPATPPWWRRWTAGSPGGGRVLLAGAGLGAVTAALLFSSWSAGVGLALCLVVLPWMILMNIRHGRRRGLR